MILFSFLSLKKFKTSVNGLSFITQSVDHFNYSDIRTFNQYFEVDERYVTDDQNPPIIIYQEGFRELETNILDLDEDLNAFAQKHHALMVGLETRGFGKSHINESFEHITMDNMIEDLENFTKYICFSYSSLEQCSVITLGRYFGGTITAIHRQKYPNSTVGSLIISAPFIFTKESNFDLYVQNLFPTQCVDDIQRILQKDIFGNQDNITSAMKKVNWVQGEDAVESFKFEMVEFLPMMKKDKIPNFCDEIHEDKQSPDLYLKYFNETIYERNFNVTQFDPLLTTRPNTLEMWYLQCSHFGLFHTKGVLYLNDDSFFDKVCLDRFNINFSQILTKNSFIPNVPASIFYNPNVTSPFYGRLNTNSNYKIQMFSTDQRNSIQKTIGNWFNRTCEKKCKSHKCVYGKCVCPFLRRGEFCDQMLQKHSSFRIVSTIAVVVPTVLFLLLGMFVWGFGLDQMQQQVRN